MNTLVGAVSMASSAHVDHVRLEVADGAIRSLMKIFPVEPDAHLRAEFELQLIESGDDARPFGILVRMAARDVGGISAELGAGVDE
jgi:hypothetical protein